MMTKDSEMNTLLKRLSGITDGTPSCEIMLEAKKEIERLLGGYEILRDCSDSEMSDGDLAREIANKMLGTPNV